LEYDFVHVLHITAALPGGQTHSERKCDYCRSTFSGGFGGFGRTVTAPRPVFNRTCGPPLLPMIVAPRFDSIADVRIMLVR
jgi:hypothetical protein